MTTIEVPAGFQLKSPQFKDWETPLAFFRKLDDEFHFTLDAAASYENALLPRYCSLDGLGFGDGLNYDWSNERVFCNPPYDHTLYQWVEKAAKRDAEVAVLLLPPSIDVQWFHDFIWWTTKQQPYPGVELRILRGRLKFWREGKVGPAPRAGNIVVVFRGK